MAGLVIICQVRTWQHWASGAKWVDCEENPRNHNTVLSPNILITMELEKQVTGPSRTFYTLSLLSNLHVSGDNITMSCISMKQWDPPPQASCDTILFLDWYCQLTRTIAWCLFDLQESVCETFLQHADTYWSPLYVTSPERELFFHCFIPFLWYDV